MLGTAPFRDQPRETVQRKILDILASEKVSVEDLVKDAVSRDQALDAFEKSVERKMADRIAANEHALAETKARIDDLRKESERLEEVIATDTGKWREWRRKKRGHEKDLARAVSYLIDREVITHRCTIRTRLNEQDCFGIERKSATKSAGRIIPGPGCISDNSFL